MTKASLAGKDEDIVDAVVGEDRSSLRVSGCVCVKRTAPVCKRLVLILGTIMYMPFVGLA